MSPENASLTRSGGGHAAPRKPAVIVISSLVSRGGVGGRASVFALERSGFPVWTVATVLLPWHPGHGRATRIVVAPGDFATLIGDLATAPWLEEVGGILTGYLGDAAQVGPVSNLVRKVKAENPAALFLCDPIIGDTAGAYQPAPVITAIRDELLPLADILTPNRFELEFLTGETLETNDRLAAAAAKLGIGETVVTSAFAAAGEMANLLVGEGGTVLAEHPASPLAPHGTGDLFAALYLGARLGAKAPAGALGPGNRGHDAPRCSDRCPGRGRTRTCGRAGFSFWRHLRCKDDAIDGVNPVFAVAVLIAAMQHSVIPYRYESSGETQMSPDKEALIRKRAYEIWEREGWPHGRDREHWDQAAREIAAEGAPAAPKRARKAAPAPAPKKIAEKAPARGTPLVAPSAKPASGRAAARPRERRIVDDPARPAATAAGNVAQAASCFGWISLRLTSTSAICTAFSAAPLRRLSETIHSIRPLSTVGSSRMRLM